MLRCLARECSAPAPHLVDGQVGVGADDCAPAEVHSLATEIPAEAPLLALQTLHKAPAQQRVAHSALGTALLGQAERMTWCPLPRPMTWCPHDMVPPAERMTWCPLPWCHDMVPPALLRRDSHAFWHVTTMLRHLAQAPSGTGMQYTVHRFVPAAQMPASKCGKCQGCILYVRTCVHNERIMCVSVAGSKARFEWRRIFPGGVGKSLPSTNSFCMHQTRVSERL